MKNLFKIGVLIFFFAFLLNETAFCQPKKQLAVVKIDSVRYPSENQIDFDIKLINTSEEWNYFANATIEIGFADSSFAISPASVALAYIDGTSELPNLQTAIPGAGLPENSYYMTPRVLDGRISVTISGPKDTADCVYLNLDQKLKIGRFSIKAINPNDTLPPKLKFLKPKSYYQALAYKTSREIRIKNVLFYNPDDNVEMDDGVNKTVVYIIDDKQPEMVVDTFYAQYKGSLRVELIWKTATEPKHKGFILKRKIWPFGEPDWRKGEFVDLVGRYDSGVPKDSVLKYDKSHFGGFEYRYLYDTVPYWDETYVYQLLYENQFGETIALDSCVIEIPNVIIYQAKATPNPFSNRTRIDYILNEDAYVTCSIYNLEGRLAEKLLDNVLVRQGERSVEFKASEYAPQGLYDVIFIAKPLDARLPAKVGRAALKIQLVR